MVRTFGPTRLETAIETARLTDPTASGLLARAFPAAGATDPTQAFADSLALGGWAAATGRQVLLSQSEVLSTSTVDHLTSAQLLQFSLVGGLAALGEPSRAPPLNWSTPSTGSPVPHASRPRRPSPRPAVGLLLEQAGYPVAWTTASAIMLVGAAAMLWGQPDPSG